MTSGDGLKHADPEQAVSVKENKERFSEDN